MLNRSEMKGSLLVIGLVLLFTNCTHKMCPSLTKEFIHPNTGYSKAVVVNTRHTKTIYVSGLTGDGDDFSSQTRTAFAHIKEELSFSGASLGDIVKMNTYIVNINKEKVDTFRSIRKEILGEKDLPASTLLGVQGLANSSRLIEIEAIAIVNKH